MSFWFRQCLELLNTLIAERSSEARRFGRSSNHLFRSQYFGKYWNYETHIFWSKCSKFNVGFIKSNKNCRKKSFVFWDNAVWSCCWKFCIFRRELLSSAANVLKNGPKLSILTKAGVFQLYLSHINGKNKIIVARCWFQRCLKLVKTLISKRCSEARSIRRLSNHFFRHQ